MKTEKVTSQSLYAMELNEIKAVIEESRRSLFGLRLNSKTAAIKDYSQFKKLRITIARGMTILSQKEHEKALEELIANFRKFLLDNETESQQ